MSEKTLLEEAKEHGIALGEAINQDIENAEKRGYAQALADNALALKLWDKIKIIPGQCEKEEKKGKTIHITTCIFFDDNENCLLEFNKEECVKYFEKAKEIVSQEGQDVKDTGK